jgi:beta-glucosidase/6-phospho-beta-glucosidase/beta-galactosidase
MVSIFVRSVVFNYSTAIILWVHTSYIRCTCRFVSRNPDKIKVDGIDHLNHPVSVLFILGIQVHITLHHLDLPQILEDEYGGWLSLRIV